MAQFKGLIFDLDGTLIDSWQDIFAAFNWALQSCGQPCVDPQELKPLMGCGMYDLLDARLGEKSAEGRALMQAYYQDNLAHKTALFSGVSEVLAQLQAKGIMMAICTNKHSKLALPLIKKFKLDQYLLAYNQGFALEKAIICRDTLSISKPQPDGLLWLCDKMQLPREQVLMVGDTKTDYLAAKAASMPIALCHFGYGDCSQLEPDYWLHSFFDLVDIVL